MKNNEKTPENVTKELKIKVASQETLRGECPECGENDLVIAGRCETCMSCGWSKCSL